tara:strand:+ start:431 stop:1057 length:627 start_codon:yes stop_codon:yes gene_type:complete
MNYNKESNLIYWATPGCSSRRFWGAIGMLGDGYSYDPNLKTTKKNIAATHTQGIPPGCENYKIVCALRNPYTRAVSSYIDLHDAGQETNFENYILNNRYKDYSNNYNYDYFYYKQWKDIKTPDYFLRLENAEEDLKNIPEYVNNLPVPWEEVVSTVSHHYGGEKPLDKYDKKGHQKVARFYNQKLANEVYNNEKIIFDIGEYKKDSWK